MKKPLRTVFLAIGLAVLAPLAADGQDIDYVQFDYLQVDEERDELLVDMLRKVWKPIHERHAAAETFVGWQLYRVEYPDGTDPGYDYVTAIYFEDWADLNYSTTWEVVQNALPNTQREDFQRYQKQTRAWRDVVRSEVVAVLNAEGSQAELDNGDYLRVDLAKVDEGTGSEFLLVQSDIWQPVYQTLMEREEAKGWFVGGRHFAGTDDPHNYMVMRAHESWNQLRPDREGLRSILSEVHSEESVNELVQRTRSSRELVRTEIWTLLDQVMN